MPVFIFWMDGAGGSKRGLELTEATRSILGRVQRSCAPNRRPFGLPAAASPLAPPGDTTSKGGHHPPQNRLGRRLLPITTSHEEGYIGHKISGRERGGVAEHAPVDVPAHETAAEALDALHDIDVWCLVR